MIPSSWLAEARQRINAHVQHTPLTYDAGQDIFLKWENKQVTGSFKARGAFNKVLSLHEWERQQGLVAASAGNHGQGVAAAGKLCAAAVTIFASEHASPIKLDAMRNLGAEVVLVAGGYGEAEQAGIAYAHNHQKTWVSPYNDGQVIAGQGTIALEIIEQLPVMPESLTWIVPVGGGGLIAGIGSALRSHATSSNHHLIGVQSEASPYFHAINYTGTQAGVKELPSLADGLSGAVEEGSITIPLVRQTVDHMLLVKEAEIARAIAFAYHQYAEIIEGSAATALAAVLTGKINLRPAVVIVSGGNIQPELHQQVCQQWDQHIIAGYTE